MRNIINKLEYLRDINSNSLLCIDIDISSWPAELKSAHAELIQRTEILKAKERSLKEVLENNEPKVEDPPQEFLA